MVPYADFLFFGLMLYPLVPTIALGLLGRANRLWLLCVTLVAFVAQYWQTEAIRPGYDFRILWIAAGFALYQGLLAWGFLRWRSRPAFYSAVALCIAPLAAAKALPILWPDTLFGFLGISFVTFRALDVLFSIHDRVLTSLNSQQYFAFVFFFPVISSGPIDRYRRFGKDWEHRRNSSEFLDDLDVAVQRVFQGFLYKFIIAALLRTYWMDRIPVQPGALWSLYYMYAYTFYLFFDFAGYSAFAIGFSRLFGIRTPENFDKPFLSRNIRDFWNRWHISLSFWFRDHIYMRFLLAAGKGKWFKGKHTASYLGLFLTFGIMGCWHGLELKYIAYGIYHATLLCGYDIFARWNKKRKFWPDNPAVRIGNIILTFHVFAFGLLLFSGRLTPPPPPKHDEVAEKIDCHHIKGWAWNQEAPDTPVTVLLYIDDIFVKSIVANELREDLRARGYGNGLHGFSFQMPQWVRDGKDHVVEAKTSDPQMLPLRGTPETISCPRAE